jgi:putative membrane protein
MYLLKRVIVLLLFVAVLLAGVLFSIQNTATAPLDLLVIQFSEQRVALWVLAAFALGGFIGMAISVFSILRLKSDIVMLNRKLKKRDTELEKLRSSDSFSSKLIDGDNEPLKNKA